MNLVFDADVSGYRSPSQKARVLTETWTVKNAYCPRCGNGTLNHFRNNAPVNMHVFVMIVKLSFFMRIRYQALLTVSYIFSIHFI